MVLNTSAAFAGLRGPARPSQPAGGIVLIYLGYLIDLAVAIDLGSLLLPLHLPLLPGDHLRDRTLMGLLLALTHRRQYFSNLLQRVIRLRSHSSSIPGSGTIVLSPQAQ